MNVGITVSKVQLAAFCQKHHIQRLAIFGSALRDDFSLESDVDVLVEFGAECDIGSFTLISK